MKLIAVVATLVAVALGGHAAEQVPHYVNGVHNEAYHHHENVAKHLEKKNKHAANEPEQFVKSKLLEHPVVLFSKRHCPFCRKAKDLLYEIGASYYSIELDALESGPEIQQGLKTMTGQSTVPNIFIGGKHIGGNDDLQALHKAGKLTAMLKEAKAEFL